MKFKGAIFDLDGTILDSMDVWERIDIAFLSKRNLPVPNDYINEICAKSFHEAAVYTIELFGLDERPENIVNEWNQMAIDEYSNHVTLRPHVREYLTLLKASGVKLAVATGLPKVLYEPVLQNNSIHDMFDAIASTDEAGRGKSFPDVFLLAAKKLAILPQECIAFEDVLQGIISAKAAGLAVYGVYDKYSEAFRSEIEKAADGYILHFQDAPVP